MIRPTFSLQTWCQFPRSVPVFGAFNGPKKLPELRSLPNPEVRYPPAVQNDLKNDGVQAWASGFVPKEPVRRIRRTARLGEAASVDQEVFPSVTGQPSPSCRR